MPGCWSERKVCRPPVQVTRRVPAAAILLGGCLLLAACADPLGRPLDLYHGLEGGEIAAQRPPPPGAGLPYPKLGTTPARPTVPTPAYRNGLQAQLLAERDRSERVAADTPIEPLPPAPPPPVAAPPAAPAMAPDFNAALAPGEPTVAAATLQAADTPPPQAPPAAKAPTAAPAGAGPPDGTALTIAGDPMDPAGAPDLPATPPTPATFEGVAAQPAPSERVLPAGLGATPSGTPLFFAPGADVLAPSQLQALRDFLAHRRHQAISIVGLGAAQSDTPDGQALALALGLRRARAVAAALVALHVPQSDLRLSARAFGSGAVLQLSS